MPENPYEPPKGEPEPSTIRKVVSLIIGLSVWGSALTFMIHGLWTGAWYGYVFGAVFIVLFGSLIVITHWGGRVSDEDWERAIRELEQDSE